MKNLLIFIVAITFIACESKEKSMGGGGKDSTGVATTIPDAQPPLDTKGYTITYPAIYTIGPNKNAETVLTLWKGWEENTLDIAKDIFADSVSLYFADGSSLMGTRDSVIAAAKAGRNTMGTIKSTVHAITSLSSDKGDDYVNVWGKEVRTNNGRVDSMEVHEVWMFKNGKANTLFQYEAKPGQVKN